MRKWNCVATAVGVWLICTSALAQESRITLGGASVERVEADLKALVNQAPPALQKQWDTLKGVLDSFTEGVDRNAPVRLDLTLGGQEAGYFFAVPYQLPWTKRRGFKDNIEAFGFKLTGPDPAGLYSVEQARARGVRGKPAAGPPPKPFYLRNAFNHSIFAPTKELLPANLPDPAIPVKALLPGATDLVADLKNDAPSMAAKRKAFQQLRKQLEAGIAFKRGEAQADFALRKLSLEQNLNEAERFLIESEHLSATWTLDDKTVKGLGELLLTALPGTDLAQSIELLVQKPSYFANVEFAPDPALQLRVNFAVDPMRTRHTTDFYAALLPVLQARMDTRPNLNDVGKAAAKEGLEKLFAMLQQGLALQVLDAIIDVHASADGKHTGICGIRAANGTDATAIVELLPKIREGWKVQRAAAEHKGVTIHAVTVAPHRLEEFQAVFGGEPVVYLGVTKEAVWGAAGEGALDQLKAAIDQTAKPAPEQVSTEFLSLEMRFYPWVKVLDVLRSKEPPLKTDDKAELEAEKQRNKARKYALDTLEGGDDVLKTSLRREQGKVLGVLDVRKGLLRLIGTLIADYTAEYLN